MSIALYHPTKTNQGFAASFKYSAKHNTIFAEIVRQNGWNEETRTGTFKSDNENNKISIKLGDIEVGGILDAIDFGRDFSTYHIAKQSDGETQKSITFKKWFSKTEPTKHTGFSFGITLENKTDKNLNENFYIGLKFSEARLVREYLIWCLNQVFTKQAQDFDNNKSGKYTENPI